jgi:hypothetical protein
MKIKANSKEYLLHFLTDQNIFQNKTVELINPKFYNKSFLDTASNFRKSRFIIQYSLSGCPLKRVLWGFHFFE